MSAPTHKTERRGAIRNKVYWGGEIVFSDYFQPFVCVVRDFSTDGARIRLPHNERLPEKFRIRVASRAVHVRVRLTWRRGDAAGVAFEGFEADSPSKRDVKPHIPKAALHPAQYLT